MGLPTFRKLLCLFVAVYMTSLCTRGDRNLSRSHYTTTVVPVRSITIRRGANEFIRYRLCKSLRRPPKCYLCVLMLMICSPRITTLYLRRLQSTLTISACPHAFKTIAVSLSPFTQPLSRPLLHRLRFRPRGLSCP
jgi:hypothetical protein